MIVRTQLRLYLLALFLPLWVYGNFLEDKEQQNSDFLDVAIIGAGHAGKGLCFALQTQGIQNVAVFDAACQGHESIWLTTARMKTLRSSKDCVGPALFSPHLSFRSWYEERKGDWDDIDKIPTHLWGQYLMWFGEVLQLPIYYEWRLLVIEPAETGLKLTFNDNRVIHTKKVVLATGRDGCGGLNIPDVIKNTLPKALWYHTSEVIDPSIFLHKKICVLGAAASAFDVAATAIEFGASHVDMLARRSEVKTANYLFLHYKNWQGYYNLPDQEKIRLIHNAFQHGFCPPPEAVQKVASYPAFTLHLETTLESCFASNGGVTLHTNKGDFEADLLIAGTGFYCDPFLVPEIAGFADQILLWRDKADGISSQLGLFPYLGESFEFLEKQPGSTPFLKNIYCFNYGSYLSHGNTGIDVDQFHIGAKRLAEGIATDLMSANAALKNP